MKASRAAAAIALAIALSVSAGCSVEIFNGNESKSSDDISRRESGSYSSQLDFPVTDTMETLPYSMKSALTQEQVNVYNRLIYDIERFELKFELENVTQEDFTRAYYAVLDDHPEYFWLGKNFSCRITTTGSYSVIVAEPVVMSGTIEEIKVMQKELEADVDRIISSAPKNGSSYDKVLYLHDYIIDNTSYDNGAVEIIDSGETDTVLNATKSYGCIVEKKAICSGYAAAFQLLCSRLGISCYLVSGTRISESGPHQWNFLELDGEYYYMDVTWDDPVRADGQSVRSYEYFLISGDDLALTHKLDNERSLPECSGKRNNYYIRNGLYFEEYDFRYVEDVAKRAEGTGEITLKFSSRQETSRAFNDLFNGDKMVFRLPGVSSGISYTMSASGRILTIRY